LPHDSGKGWEHDSQTKSRTSQQACTNEKNPEIAAGRTVAGSEIRMKYYQIKAKYIALLVAQAIVKRFIVPVVGATAASIKATLSLPHTIVTAYQDAKESAALDVELEAALIDKEFLNRASVGLTEEESKRIKSLGL
jgi:hypothetical protein